MAEVCDRLDCDYTTVKDAFVKFGRCKDTYLDVNENLKGYGGMCLPKDVKAMTKLLEKLDIDFDTFFLRFWLQFGVSLGINFRSFWHQIL